MRFLLASIILGTALAAPRSRRERNQGRNPRSEAQHDNTQSEQFLTDLSGEEISIPLDFSKYTGGGSSTAADAPSSSPSRSRERGRDGSGDSHRGSRRSRGSRQERQLDRRSGHRSSTSSNQKEHTVYVLDKLGCGAFACTYSAELKDSRAGDALTPEMITIKHYNLAENQKEYDQEVSDLEKFSDPDNYIIGFFGKHSEGDNGYIALEYAPATLEDLKDDSEISLEDSEMDSIVLDDKDFTQFTEEGLVALDNLHNCQNVFHGDVKPSNILVTTAKGQTSQRDTSQTSIRLSDFSSSNDYLGGSVKNFSPERMKYSYLWSGLGEKEWKSDIEEIFGTTDVEKDKKELHKFGSLDDVYAFGLAILEAACLKDDVIASSGDTSTRESMDAQNGELEDSVKTFLDDLDFLMEDYPEEFGAGTASSTEMEAQDKVEAARPGGWLVIKMILQGDPDVTPSDDQAVRNLPETCSKELLDLIAPMLHPSPDKRPKSSELLDSLFGIKSECKGESRREGSSGTSSERQRGRRGRRGESQQEAERESESGSDRGRGRSSRRERRGRRS